ncbi:MAG TPA: cell division protein SepF, partial [Brevibacillus sp.]|nr:cell division protein SepF [Brevibacillus sp.]
MGVMNRLMGFLGLESEEYIEETVEEQREEQQESSAKR